MEANQSEIGIKGGHSLKRLRTPVLKDAKLIKNNEAIRPEIFQTEINMNKFR